MSDPVRAALKGLRADYDAEDHLTMRDATEAFKAQQGVATTPQIFTWAS